MSEKDNVNKMERIQYELKKWLSNAFKITSIRVINKYDDLDNERRNHNKWLQKYKIIKNILVIAQLKAFLNIFVLLSLSIIAEKDQEVKFFIIKMIFFISVLILSAYFSEGMYKNRKELWNSVIVELIILQFAGIDGFLFI